jgi:hypothetical protein
MEKSMRQRGKHDKLKRKKIVSKERKYSSECHQATDLVSKLEHQESNSDAGRVLPYFTLYCVQFIPLDTFKRRFPLHRDFTKINPPFSFRRTNISVLHLVWY